MKGKPKYKLNDSVEFKVGDDIFQVYIFIIDKIRVSTPTNFLITI